MTLYENIIMDLYRKVLKEAADANGIDTRELDELAACFEIDLKKLARVTIRKSDSYEHAVLMMTKEIENRLRELDAAMNAKG